MIHLIQLSDVYPLRLEVLRETQDISSVQFPTDSVLGAFHLGFFQDVELTTVASFSPDTPDSAFPFSVRNPFRLRGMATRKTSQGKGQGSSICLAAEQIVAAVGGDCIWANARVAALPFYKKLGYEAFGEGFDIPTIGLHFVIAKKVLA